VWGLLTMLTVGIGAVCVLAIVGPIVLLVVSHVREKRWKKDFDIEPRKFRG